MKKVSFAGLKKVPGYEAYVDGKGRVWEQFRGTFRECYNDPNSSGRARVKMLPDGGKKRRRITKARAVWAAHNGKDVPKGFHVDHKDENKKNDHPSNLQLLTNGENVRKGYARNGQPNAGRNVLMTLGGVKKVFGNAAEAAKFVGVTRKAVVEAILRDGCTGGWKPAWL